MTLSSFDANGSRATRARPAQAALTSLVPQVPARRQPGCGPDGEEGDEIDEVAVLDELLSREPEVEGGHLEEHERHEDAEQRRECVRFPPIGVNRGRHEPRCREDDGQDPDANSDLVEVRGCRAPESVGNQVSPERDDVVADDAPELP